MERRTWGQEGCLRYGRARAVCAPPPPLADRSKDHTSTNERKLLALHLAVTVLPQLNKVMEDSAREVRDLHCQPGSASPQGGSQG